MAAPGPALARRRGRAGVSSWPGAVPRQGDWRRRAQARTAVTADAEHGGGRHGAIAWHRLGQPNQGSPSLSDGIRALTGRGQGQEAAAKPPRRVAVGSRRRGGGCSSAAPLSMPCFRSR